MGEYSHHALYAARRRLGGRQGTCPYGMHNHRGGGLDRRGRAHPRLPRAGGVNRRHGGQGCQCGRRAQEILLLQHFHLRRGDLLLLCDALWPGLDCHRGLPAVLLCRYVDWTITTALLILDLGLVAGQDFVTIAAVIGADMLMITAGYMGAVSVVTTVKWFWFLFGMAMFLPVIYSLARTFRETVITRKDPEMIELYGKIAWLTIIMWSFYPVVWLFSEGFASFSVSFEVVAYTILDIISKVVFSFMIVSAHDSLGSTSAPQMQSREYV